MRVAINIFQIIIILILLDSPFVALGNKDCAIQNDTIFLAPDTIRKTVIDTIYEYEEDAQTPIQHTKKDDRSMLIGGNIILDVNYFHPLYNKISPSIGAGFATSFSYNHWFIDADLFISTTQSVSPQYTTQFSNTVSWTDTIKTLIDNYYQIVKNDTIYTPIYKTNYIGRSKTIESDTTYTSQNRYTSFSLPIAIGYCIKKRKTWLGCGGGVQCKFTKNWNGNNIVIDNRFENEDHFFRSISIGIHAKCFIKQKITRKWWLSATIFGATPLYSQYSLSTDKLLVTNWGISIGLQHFFRFSYKESSEAKHF